VVNFVTNWLIDWLIMDAMHTFGEHLIIYCYLWNIKWLAYQVNHNEQLVLTIYCNTYSSPNDYRHECLISQPKKNTGPHPLLRRRFTTVTRARLHDTNCITEMLLGTRMMLLLTVVFPINLLIQTNTDIRLHWTVNTVVHFWTCVDCCL